MFENNNVNTTEQQQVANQQEQNAPEEKTFTQKELNDIVEKRLARERKKFTGMLEGKDPKELEIEEREKAVTIKELKADIRGILREKNLPDEALELLNYTDKESCEQSLKALEGIVNKAVEARLNIVLRGDRPPKRSGNAMQDFNPNESVKSAFGLK